MYLTEELCVSHNELVDNTAPLKYDFDLINLSLKMMFETLRNLRVYYSLLP